MSLSTPIFTCAAAGCVAIADSAASSSRVVRLIRFLPYVDVCRLLLLGAPGSAAYSIRTRKARQGRRRRGVGPVDVISSGLFPRRGIGGDTGAFAEHSAVVARP